MDPQSALEKWVSGWNDVLEHQHALNGWLAAHTARPVVEISRCDDPDGESAMRGEVIGVTTKSIVVYLDENEIVTYTPFFDEQFGPHFMNSVTYQKVYLET